MSCVVRDGVSSGCCGDAKWCSDTARSLWLLRRRGSSGTFRSACNGTQLARRRDRRALSVCRSTEAYTDLGRAGGPTSVAQSRWRGPSTLSEANFSIPSWIHSGPRPRPWQAATATARQPRRRRRHPPRYGSKRIRYIGEVRSLCGAILNHDSHPPPIGPHRD